MSEAHRLHNEISSDVLRRIVTPVVESGGGTSAIMVILESVVSGVLTACARIDGHNAQQRDSMLMALEDGVRRRLEKMPVTGRISP